MRRVLAALAILSLLFGAFVLVMWARSPGHVDQIPLGHWDGFTWSATSHAGRVMVSKTFDSNGIVNTQSTFVDHWRLAVACLSLPALWVAVEIRRKLPKPPGRGPRMLPRT